MSNVGKMSQVLNAYPVGSIYMSVNSTNPGELFGGTWEQIQGRFCSDRVRVILRVRLAEKRIMRYLIMRCPVIGTGLLPQPMMMEMVRELVAIVSIMGYGQMLVAIQQMIVGGTMDDIPRGLVAMAQGKLIEMSLRTIICHLILSYIFGSGRLNH